MTKKLQDAYLKFVEEGDDKDLLSVVNSYKDVWLRDRQQTQDRKWNDARAFYAGNHDIRGLLGSNSNRIRVRENHLNNTIQRIQSIFVQNLPIVRAFPASDSRDDVNNAETAEMFLKGYAREYNLEVKFGDLSKRGCIYGNALTYTTFDPGVRGVMTLGPDETMSGDTEEHKFKGDIRVRVESPHMYCFRPGVYSLEDHYDYVRMEPVAKADLEATFGEIKADAVKIFNSASGLTRIDDDVVMQYHYYHKPTSWFEEGLYVCWAGNRILKANEYPFDSGRLNITHFAFDTVPDQFWGLSSIEQVMDLQEQLNNAASMIIKARNMIARPKVLASHESQVPGQSIGDRDGEIVRYKAAGGAPQFYVPSFNFGEMAAHKGDLRNALGLVSGVTGASRGEIPQATRTALALQLVLEQDRSQFLPTIKRFHGAIHDTYYNILATAAQYITQDDPRRIKIEGRNGATKLFHGGMVPSSLDVYLEDTNPLGWTGAGRAEQVQNLVSAGLIKDPNKALEMMQLNITDPSFELIKINRQAQQKEIELMMQGEPLEIGPADMDSVHLEELDKTVSNFSFRELPEAVQSIILMHRDAHMQRTAQAGVPPPTGSVDNIEGLANNLAPPVPQGIEGVTQGAGQAA